MASNNPVGTQLSVQYCTEYPKTASRTLAKLMVKENPGVFSSEESARSAIRNRRGSMGKFHRKKKPLGDFQTPEYKPAIYIPPSDESTFTPYTIQDPEGTWLILSDIHVPYHSVSALTATLEYARDREIDGLILNGDTLDFHRLSRFNKDPRARGVVGEIQACNELLLIRWTPSSPRPARSGRMETTTRDYPLTWLTQPLSWRTSPRTSPRSRA
jgi:hypothetical protein